MATDVAVAHPPHEGRVRWAEKAGGGGGRRLPWHARHSVKRILSHRRATHPLATACDGCVRKRRGAVSQPTGRSGLTLRYVSLSCTDSNLSSGFCWVLPAAGLLAAAELEGAPAQEQPVGLENVCVSSKAARAPAGGLKLGMAPVNNARKAAAGPRASLALSTLLLGRRAAAWSALRPRRPRERSVGNFGHKATVKFRDGKSRSRP